jgi:pseudouridine-5'-phosphate glycosidase
MDYSLEVQVAIESGMPIVALESTIITHGMEYPTNVETALSVEKCIRDNGAIPATIAIMKGRIKVICVFIEWLYNTDRPECGGNRRNGFE